MNSKISIIIPAYNAGHYIEQCVKGVLCQTYSDFEIIIVDDGSNSNSADIYREIAQDDARITLWRQNNQGAAVARNFGLVKSTGEYIVFLDADDYWNDDKFLEKAMQDIKLKECDVLLFGCLHLKNGKYYNPQKRINKKKACGRLTKDKLEYIFGHVYNIISPCSKIIKKEFLVKNNITFPEGKLHEDIDWAMRLLDACNTFEIFDGAPYIRRVRKDSASKQRTLKDCMDMIWLLEKWTNTVDSAKDRKVFYGQLCFQLFILMGMSEDIKEKQIVQKELKNYYWLRKYHNNTKTLFGFIATCLFPFGMCCKIFNTYIKR